VFHKKEGASAAYLAKHQEALACSVAATLSLGIILSPKKKIIMVCLMIATEISDG